jgi:hypothetical protein
VLENPRLSVLRYVGEKCGYAGVTNCRDCIVENLIQVTKGRGRAI